MRTILFLLSLIAFTGTGCKKYLDAKPDKSLVIPRTLKDAQALLDNSYLMNIEAPTAGEASADNYYLSDESYNALYSQAYKNLYNWGDEISLNLYPSDWEIGYDQAYPCNVALETLSGVARTTENAAAWDNVEGSALYYRANAFLKVAYTWALAYDSATAATGLGIPLRLHSDFNEVSQRASVQETYDRVISDLTTAMPLLPVTPLFRTRPGKPAAYALLARTYLAMGNYADAGRYANSSLQLYHTLLNYNAIDSNAVYPFEQLNAETVLLSSGYGATIDEYTAKIDTSLYDSYDDNDLRKILFFRANDDGSHAFRGTYVGGYGVFTGIATDEAYLMRAECYARTGNVTEALADLNILLLNRYRTGTYQPFAMNNAVELLDIILKERRKELLMRDLRWMDVKRLNKESRYAVTLTRFINGIKITLPSNDPRYALPLPRTVIELTGMPQNPR